MTQLASTWNLDGVRLVRDLADKQVEKYRIQYRDLIGDFNHEQGVLDGYRGRQLLELLQNADDQGANKEGGNSVLFRLTPEMLIVANTGTSFSSEGIHSLVISDCSPKQLERTRFIGYKGLGFRSILTWTEQPTLVSGDFAISFSRAWARQEVERLTATHPELRVALEGWRAANLPIPAPIMRFPFVPASDDPTHVACLSVIDEGYTTAIALPFPSGAKRASVHAEVAEQLRSLSTPSLIFCNHLTDVRIEGDVQASWRLERLRSQLSAQDVVVHQGEKSERWRVSQKTGRLPKAVRDEYRDTPGFELRVAIPEKVESNDAGRLCVFFPTDDVLPIAPLLHATLDLTDTRKRVIDNPANRHVLGELAKFFGYLIEREWSRKAPLRPLSLLKGLTEADPELQTLGLVQAIIVECRKRRIFPRRDRTAAPATRVFSPLHPVWQEVAKSKHFDKMLAVEVDGTFAMLLRRFNLGWFPPATLKSLLEKQLRLSAPKTAGTVVGALIRHDQLPLPDQGRYLIDADGRPIAPGVTVFVEPTATLQALPSWFRQLRFLHADFQQACATECWLPSARELTHRLGRIGIKIEEYSFETLARQLITASREATGVSLVERTRDVLRWLNRSLPGRDPNILRRLIVPVITQGGRVRTAYDCYLGPDYGRGRPLHAVYSHFGQDEFTASPADLGLSDVGLDRVESLLVSAGVADRPRLRQHDFRGWVSRDAAFVNHVLEQQTYPCGIRGKKCESAQDVKRTCNAISVLNVSLPDRFFEMIERFSPEDFAACFVTIGASFLNEDNAAGATFSACVDKEYKPRADETVRIPNPCLFFLKTTNWVPCLGDQTRRKPNEIILTHHASRYLRGVYHRHAIDVKHSSLVASGGRRAVDGLLLHLGALNSIDSMAADDMYQLLIRLPEQDPKGRGATGVYRSLIEAGFAVTPSPYQRKFFEEGRIFSNFQGGQMYLPVREVRYNANVSLPSVISHLIKLVDLPRSKNAKLIEHVLGVKPLSRHDIRLAVSQEGTTFQQCSETANGHLKKTTPYLYALRLFHKLDENQRECRLFRELRLRVCERIRLALSLFGRAQPDQELIERGQGLSADGLLFIVWDEEIEASSRTRFWCEVGNLLAELIGADISAHAANLLRCKTQREMKDVLDSVLGSEADAKLEEAFKALGGEEEDEEEFEIPPPAEAPAQPPVNGREAPAEPVAGGDRPANKPGDDDSGQPKTFEKFQIPPKRKPAKRRLVIGPSPRHSHGPIGPVATQEQTFRVVEEFERHQGRFSIRVSHLTGNESFGCDVISVSDEATYRDAVENKRVDASDITRFIEVSN
jgi:hypothetical protein